MATDSGPRMTAAELTAFVDREFPQIHMGGRVMTIEDTSVMGARVRMARHERSIRPGGTISGPAMFTLADFSVWVAVMANIGPEALAVTTNLNINFLKRPAARDMIAKVSIIKLGKRLAVAEVELYTDGDNDMVAHATATYSIPPEAKR